LSGWLAHLAIAPVIIPLLAGTLMVLIGERRRRAKAALGLASVLALLAVAIMLLRLVDGTAPGMGAATGPPRPCRCTGWATGRRCSASCWCSTGSPR
jgi:multicomponent K+:H+ antiporter subunit D